MKVKMHKHLEHVENIYVTQGEGKFHLGATTYHIEPGDLIVVPKNTWHGVEVTSDVDLATCYKVGIAFPVVFCACCFVWHFSV